MFLKHFYLNKNVTAHTVKDISKIRDKSLHRRIVNEENGKLPMRKMVNEENKEKITL